MGLHMESDALERPCATDDVVAKHQAEEDPPILSNRSKILISSPRKTQIVSFRDSTTDPENVSDSNHQEFNVPIYMHRMC
jgi:hypothetical protein